MIEFDTNVLARTIAAVFGERPAADHLVVDRAVHPPRPATADARPVRTSDAAARRTIAPAGGEPGLGLERDSPDGRAALGRRPGRDAQLPSTMSAGTSVGGRFDSVAKLTAAPPPLPSASNSSSPEALV